MGPGRKEPDVHLTVVTPDGCVRLGDGLRHLGYTPGSVVQVITTCTGVLMLRLDDRPALDLPPVKPLPEKRQPKALTGGGHDAV